MSSRADRRTRGFTWWHEPGRGGPIPFDVLADFRAPPPGRVLSVYAGIDARRGEALDRARLLRPRAVVDQLASGLADEAEAAAVRRLGAWALDRIGSGLGTAGFRRALAFFATDAPRWLHVLTLARPMEVRASWGAGPDLDPLRAFERENPTTGVAVLGGEVLRLVSVRLGDIVDERAYTLDLDTEQWRRMEGPMPSVRTASATTQVDRFAARRAAWQTRWLRGLRPLVAAAAEADGWERLAVVAAPDALAAADELPQMTGLSPAVTIDRNFVRLPSAEIVERVLEALDVGVGRHSTAIRAP